MSTILKLCGVLAIGATLTACGATPAERAATGALGGAALAAVTDENVVNGALIGGAAGGLGTCLINPNASGCF